MIRILAQLPKLSPGGGVATSRPRIYGRRIFRDAATAIVSRMLCGNAFAVMRRSQRKHWSELRIVFW